MPAGTWSPTRERQYKHILTSCIRSRGRGAKKTCQRIAGATVNATRRRKGELGSARKLVPDYMGMLSDAQLRRNLCYQGQKAREPARTYLEKRVNRDVLAESRDEAKRRGWKPKRIRRAEHCRGSAL